MFNRQQTQLGARVTKQLAPLIISISSAHINRYARMKCILIYCVVAVVSSSMLRPAGAQRTTTVTLTESRTITSTAHLSTDLACAQLVNVTGRCRQRRGFPAEEPVILVMDYREHNNWVIDHQPPFGQFIPTQTFSVEATPLAIITDWSLNRPIDFQPPAKVEPSTQQGRNNKNHFNRQQQQQGSYFSKLLNVLLFNSIVSTVNVTVTNVFTHTLSTTTTNTTSFILMGCTPSPLHYSVCPASPSSAAAAAPSNINSATSTTNSDEERKILFHLWNRYRWRPFVTYSVVRRTSTITAAVISSTVGLCAQLVNVTGPCRLRRGLWVDDPVVLSFDDDMDSIDQALSPSKTLSIEPTVMSTELSIESRGQKSGRSASNFTVRSSSADSPDSPEELEEDEELSQRLGFLNLVTFYSAIRRRIQFITLTTTAAAVTVIRTSTYYVTVSTKTFFVQICTPTPFPFSVCPRSGRK